MCSQIHSFKTKTEIAGQCVIYLPLLLTDFTHCSGVSIGDFEQIDGQWFKSILLKLDFILIFYYIAITNAAKIFLFRSLLTCFIKPWFDLCCFSKLLCTIFVSMFMLTEVWFICTFLKKWYKIEKKEEKKALFQLNGFTDNIFGNMVSVHLL